MTYSNSKHSQLHPADTASISLSEFWTTITAFLRYSPQDSYIKAQDDADVYEAAQSMPTNEELEGLNRTELAEALRLTKKFNFWV